MHRHVTGLGLRLPEIIRSVADDTPPVALARPTLGSAAEKVSRHVEVPVLLVR